MESAQQRFQLRDVKRRRRTAAEVNRRWTQQGAAVSSSPTRFVQFELAQEPLTKSRGLRTIQQIFVKRAIRTNPRAEGNVNVDVLNGAKLLVLELYGVCVRRRFLDRRFTETPYKICRRC